MRRDIRLICGGVGHVAENTVAPPRVAFTAAHEAERVIPVAQNAWEKTPRAHAGRLDSVL